MFVGVVLDGEIALSWPETDVLGMERGSIATASETRSHAMRRIPMIIIGMDACATMNLCSSRNRKCDAKSCFRLGGLPSANRGKPCSAPDRRHSPKR